MAKAYQRLETLGRFRTDRLALKETRITLYATIVSEMLLKREAAGR